MDVYELPGKTLDLSIKEFDIEAAFLGLQDQLESYLYRLAANQEDSRDLVQDTYLRVKQKFHSFQAKSSFKTWVFTIATNLAKDHQRVKNRWAADALDECRRHTEGTPRYQQQIVEVFNRQPERQFEIADHINLCFTCLAKNLPLDQQLAVVLKEMYHFKRQEIADILDKSEGVVKHLLHEGRKTLQTRYEQRCALVNKRGVCYQCAELNDFLQARPDSEEKIRNSGLDPLRSPEENLQRRFAIINRINPLKSPGAPLEDTILQILREAIQEP